MQLFKYLVLLLTLIFLQKKVVANELDSLLLELEQAMAMKSKYDNEKEVRIANLKALLNKAGTEPEQHFYVYDQLIEEYRTFTFDSTLHYISLSVELANSINKPELIYKADLKLARLLASSGRYLEAVDVLKRVNAVHLSKALLVDYYTDLLKVYSDLSIYTPSQENHDKYDALAKSYADSLLTLVEPESEIALSLLEKRYRDDRKIDESLEINSQRLAKVKMGTPSYSVITFERALNYRLKSDTENEKKYLILSAISDIKASVKDNASLSNLALLLHKERNIDRAHAYINFSFEDASFYNSRLRFIEISNILPVINEAYQLKNERQRQRLKRYLIIISVLSIILVFAIFYIQRQIKKLSTARNELQDVNQQLNQLNSTLSDTNQSLSKLNEELSETNHVKEHYIGNFLSICSDYIDKMEAFKNMVKKQILAGKVEELLKTTKSNKLIEEETKVFYQNFDSVFLHIFPNFVHKLNSLLSPEEQIILKKDEMLNTELRIFALIRLGINDSSNIAKLLRYSVNTIYNYRVKIKNKAIHREDFEKQVMQIGAIIQNSKNEK